MKIEKKYLNKILEKPNVIGFSKTLKKKIKKGVITDEDCVRVYVSKKIPLDKLKPEEVIPPEIEINGKKIKTDVVQIGHVKPLELVDRVRPVEFGVSVGRIDTNSAGTLGWVVKSGNNYYFISNAHVFKNEDKWNIGDKIVQPATIDGGDEDDIIGEIVYCSEYYDHMNVDLGVAKALTSFIPKFYTVDLAVTGVTYDYTEGKEIQKVGRTTGYTKGVIFDDSACVQVDYGFNQYYVDDVIIGDIEVQGGDSGSCVVDSDGKFVGLVFAKGEKTIICKSIHIMNELQKVFGNCEIVTGDYTKNQNQKQYTYLDYLKIVMYLAITVLVIYLIINVFKTITHI